jgi:hypothetical protein
MNATTRPTSTGFSFGRMQMNARRLTSSAGRLSNRNRSRGAGADQIQWIVIAKELIGELG